jgi:hypothetical protein
VFIDRHNDDHIRVAPCCQAETQLSKVDSFNFVTDPYLTELRSKFKQGQKPNECHSCWEVEAVGHRSRRMSSIQFFDLEQPNDTIQLESLDHSATWACNLACIMCGPLNSSTWAAELNLNTNQLHKLGRKFQRNNDFLEHVDTSQLRRLHFNGGEPLINNDQIALLEKLEQQGVLKNIQISYNTNGTVEPNKKLLTLWSKAQLVKLFFSIDATNTAFEYVRYPGKWQQASNNIINLRRVLPSNVMFGFNTTVGCYNLFEIVDVLQWFQNNLSSNLEGDPSEFYWQFAKNFDLKHLNYAAKSDAINQLGGKPEIAGIVNYIKSVINYTASDNWIHALENLDSSRNTNWKQTFKVAKHY